MLIKEWRRHYNEVRSHSSIGYRQPAPVAKIPEDNNRENYAQVTT